MRFTYTRPDGGVSIVVAAPKEHLERVCGPLTQEQYRTLVIERSKPADAIDFEEMPEGWEPPADRTFRNALVKVGKDVTHDMAKARNIHRERMREARAPLLAALDVEYQRADERGSVKVKADITARKQALRDVTDDPRLEAAKTPDDLKTVWPVELGGKVTKR